MTTDSRVIYARVPVDVRNAVGNYAADQGTTLAGAVTALLRRALKAPPEPSAAAAEFILDGLADRLAARLNLAIVQQVPQRLLNAMREGSETVQPAMMIRANYGVFRFTRAGNVLTVGIELDNQRLATFRFEGDHTPEKVPEIINGRFTGHYIDARR
jgi:hypothetical protein